MLYSLAGGDDVVRLLHALGRVGERNVAEIERVMAAYFRARDELEPVSREDLLARLRDGLVTVLDVRPEDEFAPLVGEEQPACQAAPRLSWVWMRRRSGSWCK